MYRVIYDPRYADNTGASIPKFGEGMIPITQETYTEYMIWVGEPMSM